MAKPSPTEPLAAEQRAGLRISIQAFCEFPDTGIALQRAGSDRRLAKAHLQVQLGGIAGATQHYHAQTTPDLLIVETRLGSAQALAELDALAQVCDPATKVIVVGRVNDVELYRELMRRGACEYLIAPLEPLQLIDAICRIYLAPGAAPLGRVVAVVGARGGAGSSTVAHNLGWCIAEELHIDTAIVDLDLNFGTLGLDFNDDAGQGVYEALAAPERLDNLLLDRLLLKRGEHLSLFTAAAVLERDSQIPPQAYEVVIDALRQTSRCVILDLPHGWQPWIKACLIGADDIVIVATPDLTALRNAKNIIELVRSCRPNDDPPHLVINQLGMPRRPEIPCADFAQAVGLDPCVLIGFEPALFGEAANSGQMVMELAQRAPVAEALRRLCRTLTGAKPQSIPDRNSSSIFSFLKRR